MYSQLLNDLWHLGFLQRAFLAGLLVAAICPAIGLFLVVRRLSLLGECLAHVSLAGAALGLAAGIGSSYTTLGAALAAAAGLEYLRRAYTRYADLAVAVTTAAGLGVTAVLASSGQVNMSAVVGFLFGSLVAITPQEMTLVLLLGSIVVLTLFLLYRSLFYLAVDEEGARVAGIPVGWLSLFFLFLTATAVSLTMRLVGALLLASLMTLPVASALALARSFRQALFLSIGFGEITIVVGLALAYYLNTAPGGTIVLSSVGILLTVFGSRAFFRRPQTRKGRVDRWLKQQT